MSARRMLQGPYLSVLEAKDAADLKAQVIHFAHSRGFGTGSAMAVIDQSLTHTEFHTVHNAPDDYIESFNDEVLAMQDPVMQHSKHSSLPLLWDQETYVHAGKGELWEHQAQYGYRVGIALALHFPDGRHFAFGVESHQPLPANPATLASIVGDVQLFAVHAQEAAFRIFSPPIEPIDSRFLLTPREREALRWTMDGKTAADVGIVMNISERTAVFHLQNAVRKLQCKTKHQAVLKAMRLRLLTWR
jgi:DNA-binding CsgD family transcriptional regulator